MQYQHCWFLKLNYFYETELHNYYLIRLSDRHSLPLDYDVVY